MNCPHPQPVSLGRKELRVLFPLPYYVMAQSRANLDLGVGLLFYLFKAAPRFELGDKGFADLCLTTWLCRRKAISYYK